MYEKKLYKIGLQIKKARLDADFTHEALAHECDINPTYLRGIESGSKTPSHSLLMRICKATQKEPNFFYAPYVVIQNDPDDLDRIVSQLGTEERERAARMLAAAFPHTI